MEVLKILEILINTRELNIFIFIMPDYEHS